MGNITKWVFSADSETERILHTAHQTYVGFYKNNGFIVLPKKVNSNSSNSVILPDLNFASIPRFWDRVSKINIGANPMVIDNTLKADFRKLLLKQGLQEPDYDSVRNTWSKAEKEVIKTIYDVLPNKRGAIKEIIIYPTTSGTVCSFDWDNKGLFIIYLREGQGIHKITEALLTSLTREDVYKKLNGVWQESEIIVDFLVTQTKIADVLKKYEDKDEYIATIKGTRTKDNGKLTTLSDEYYRKLSIPTFNKPFSLNGLTPEVNKKPLTNLRLHEKQIMFKLIKNSNNIVSFDDLAEILFKEDDFSLFAIAKVIQRLRDKLETNGISGSYIQTLRGKGYLLKN